MTTTNNKIPAVIKPASIWIIWLLMLRLTGAFEGFIPPNIKSCVYGILGSIYAFLLTWLYLRSEKLSFRDIGLTFQAKTPIRFFLGAAIGAVAFIVMTTLLLFFGKLHLNFTGAPLANILQSVITLFFLALMEEIAFRSYPFLKLKDNFGLFIAQLIAAIGFASYHLAIGWNLQTAIMGPFVWAWVYGLAAIWSRGIALPTGLHMTINVGQSLTGMSGFAGAVWKIDYNTAVHADTQVILIALHAVVFLVAVGLTWRYCLKQDLND